MEKFLRNLGESKGGSTGPRFSSGSVSATIGSIFKGYKQNFVFSNDLIIIKFNFKIYGVVQSNGEFQKRKKMNLKLFTEVIKYGPKNNTGKWWGEI